MQKKSSVISLCPFLSPLIVWVWLRLLVQSGVVDVVRPCLKRLLAAALCSRCRNLLNAVRTTLNAVRLWSADFFCALILYSLHKGYSSAFLPLGPANSPFSCIVLLLLSSGPLTPATLDTAPGKPTYSLAASKIAARVLSSITPSLSPLKLKHDHFQAGLNNCSELVGCETLDF